MILRLSPTSVPVRAMILHLSSMFTCVGLLYSDYRPNDFPVSGLGFLRCCFVCLPGVFILVSLLVSLLLAGHLSEPTLDTVGRVFLTLVSTCPLGLLK